MMLAKKFIYNRSKLWLSSLVFFSALNFISLMCCHSAFAESPTAESDTSQQVTEPKQTTKEKNKQSNSEPKFHALLPQAFRWTGAGAWQPPKGEWYLGLSESYWAPFSWLSLHTWTTPWVIGAANLGLRLPLWTSKQWSLGFSSHLMYLDLSKLGEDSQSKQSSSQAIRISPISLYAAYQLSPKWLLGTELKSTIVSGSTRANQDQSFNGVAATSNSHFRLQLAYALGEKWSLWWVWSRLNQQSTSANAYSKIALQNGGSLEVYGVLDSDIINFRGATANTLKLLYRGDTFTGMLGVAFGAPSIYYLGTVVEKIKLLPLLELGWRF